MTQDTHKTKVVFFMDIPGENNMRSEVFAFFPETMYNENKELRTCYSHVGQHSACSLEYIAGCDIAYPDQYKDLATELESIGYNLEILTSLY